MGCWNLPSGISSNFSLPRNSVLSFVSRQRNSYLFLCRRRVLSGHRPHIGRSFVDRIHKAYHRVVSSSLPLCPVLSLGVSSELFLERQSGALSAVDCDLCAVSGNTDSIFLRVRSSIARGTFCFLTLRSCSLDYHNIDSQRNSQSSLDSQFYSRATSDEARL
ncbi:hypothetical protein OESDEN_16054 [Oesophagostomum dentatum]|uniref:Uncharacterized protein n=1 Tax=Oesophagostomum dentatum TaxID=61180 RepID=A0A0B1SM20_OESDE|nr:hypothetical protein OESDEN_16054 [Oesophagostomum dentatum]